jgi:uncharacterized repeat protein (TIGR01451 family)
LTQQALAAGTASGTQIDNRATVNYTVGGVSQTPIESSPTGNTTAGTGNGAVTRFLVDNRVDLTVVELSGNATPTTPGANNVVAAFTVTNTGNTAQGYALAPTNVGGTLFGEGDDFDMNNLRVFVDSNGNDTYDPADTATSIDTLAADDSVTVFIVADTPLAAQNAQASNVRLTATTAVAGTAGATLVAETTGADSPTVVDVVFADGNAGGNVPRNGAGFADDQYFVSAAGINVQKTSATISDPFNGTASPKAIPGATVEYAIVLSNSTATAANGVVVTDPLPANTTFATGAYNSGASDVQINVGSAAATFCVAEAGSDTNADGCFRTAAGVLTVQSPAVSTVANGSPVTVRFRVTIN